MKKTLRPYQSAALDEVSRHFSEGNKRVILCCPTGGGKCLGFGTPVLMFDGTIKTVENVAVGDLLMGPDSAPRRVKSVCTGREELFRVTPIKGDSYVVNRSHILSLKTTPSERGEEVVTKNVPVTEWLFSTKWFKHIHKGWRTAVDFDARPTHPAIPPYFLGLWLGDGSAERPSVTKPDPEVLEYMTFLAGELGMEVTSTTLKSCPTISIVRKTRFESNRVLDALREMNLTSNKHVPMMYKANSREVRLEVMAGLMDSDGSLSKSGYDFISKDEQLADDVCFLARSLGMAAYKTPCKKTCSNNGVTGDYFRVSITGDCDMIPCKIARKKCPPRGQKKNVLVTGITLSSMGVGDYYGFEIEGNDRLFLLGDFTVTHNTTVGSNAVLRAVERGKKVLWVAHRSELVDQAAAELASTTGRRIGIIQGSRKPDPSALIQVATIQTLIRRENIPPADLVVGDEAHRMLAKQWHALLETYSKSYFLYLTATPERGDGKPMSDLADVIVPTVQPSELIDEGVLVPCEIIAPNAEIAKGLAEDPVSAYLQWGGRRRAVFFCQTKEHARRVTESLESNGIPAGMVTDDTPWATRKAIYKKVHSGQLLALVNVFVATEGLDIPPLEVCVIARTMGHASMYVQCLDSDTEVLTNRGFVGMDDILDSDKVAAMDLSSGESSWEDIEAVYKRNLGDGEKMFSISSPHLDIRVTGGHRMVYTGYVISDGNKKIDSKWSVMTADEMQSKRSPSFIPVSSNMSFPGVGLTKSQLEFIGWYLTDGCKSKRGTQISIVQADHQPQIEHLRRCLVECGYTFKEYKRNPVDKGCFPNGKMQTIFSVPSGRRSVYAGKEVRGWSDIEDFMDKDIGQAFDRMTREEFLNMIVGMHYGNGRKCVGADYNVGTYSISIGRETMANRIQAMAVVRGFRCNVSKSKTSNCWQLVISDQTRWFMLSGKDRGRPSFSESEQSKSEKVWCVENRLGTLFIRRNGKVSIVGNCVGRILRASKGKSSGLIIDLKGVVEKYGSPEADRHYHLEGEEAVTLDDKGAAKRLKCPDCGSLRSGPVCPVCGLAFGSDRPPVPDIVSTPLEVKVSIDRTDDAAAEYIRIVHDKFDKKVKNFAREASIAFRERRNSPPASDWITLYADFLRGQLTPARRPSWWPADVEMSLYRRTQHAAAE